MKFRVLTIPTKKLKHYQFNPSARTLESSLKQLREDIRKSSIIAPLFVRADGDDYKVLDGNRRLAIAKEMGITELQCLISDDGLKLNEDDTFVLLNKQRSLNGHEQLDFAIQTNKFISNRFKQNYNYLINLGGTELVKKCLAKKQSPNSIAPAVMKIAQIFNKFDKDFMIKSALWMIENKQVYKFRTWNEFSSDVEILRECIIGNKKLPPIGV